MITILAFYVDPGSGMMLLQVLLASLAGVVFHFRALFFNMIGKSKSVDMLPKALAASKANAHSESAAIERV